ncbi:hypothetical protein ACN47E_004034 [Coniothyrium glycines]
MADEGATINLRILSPSTEVEGGVTFPHLPASTTVQELRSRIQDAVPSKPAPERMRLIYRGRVVANDAATLGVVFGADNIRECRDQSLHLVLRELPQSTPPPPPPPPRAAAAPPNPFRPLQVPTAASPSQTNPFRPTPQPQPNSQPQTPQLPPHHLHPHNHPHGHHHHPLPAPGNAFVVPVPPQLPQHLAQALVHNVQAQMQAQAQAQAQARAQTPVPQGPQPNGPTPPPAGLPLPPPGFVPPVGPQNIPGRMVRQEGIGPNGERWSVTYNEVNIPARPQHPLMPPQFGVPPGFALPPRPAGSPASFDGIDRVLPRLRTILDSARREMQNVTTLFQLPESQHGLGITGPPSWRVQRIREHIQTMTRDLDLVERGLAIMLADVTLSQNPDVVALRQSAVELRGHAEEMSRMLAREQHSVIASQSASTASTATPLNTTPTTSSSASSTSIPLQAQGLSSAPTMPSDTPAELFILSSPQGPVGILFDPRGSYTTAPMVSTLPFQTFSSQFAQNRQLIAGLGQQMAQGSGQLHNQLANIQPTPTPTQQPGTGGQGTNETQNQPELQNQQQPPQQAANGNANPPAAEHRMVNIAGHLWLIIKLACFVYFFAGGGGLYRPIMLGTVAAVVYLAQIGIFDNQFNQVRHHFEALLPVGALADRIVQPRDANAQQQRAGGLTPAQAAQRLLQRQQDERFGWAREGMRTLERSFALFVASLWPGIGERMVHAQEERLRLERVAESEERERQEEARRQEVAAQQAERDQKDETEPEKKLDSSVSSKGKERAETSEGEASISTSTSSDAS